MMRRTKTLLTVLAMAGLALVPCRAGADGFVSPWAGTQFGSNVHNSRGGFGVTAGAMGAGVAGGELDFGFSPSFFGTQNDFGNNTVIDLMGNLILGVPIGGTHGGGLRPYAVGGLGLLRTQIDGGNVFTVSTSSNHLAWDLGAGAMGYFNDHVGVRGDVRYFRNITGDTINNVDFGGGFHYWRLSLGLVIR